VNIKWISPGIAVYLFFGANTNPAKICMKLSAWEKRGRSRKLRWRMRFLKYGFRFHNRTLWSNRVTQIKQRFSMDQIISEPESKTFRCVEPEPNVWVPAPQRWREEDDHCWDFYGTVWRNCCAIATGTLRSSWPSKNKFEEKLLLEAEKSAPWNKSWETRLTRDFAIMNCRRANGRILWIGTRTP